MIITYYTVLGILQELHTAYILHFFTAIYILHKDI